MKKFIRTGVIGHPIDHSKSPLIHNYWIEKYKLSGSYEAINIKPEELYERLPQLLYKEDYSGFNLTLPHKEIALEICDDIDDVANAVGAVNTVWVENGRIQGTNTDVFGFMENIRQTTEGHDWSSGAAIILGAGGAARAVLHALLETDVEDIYILNRTLEKAEELAVNDVRVSAVTWGDRNDSLPNASIVVNTTSLGMKGQVNLDLNLDALPMAALVCDIVYNPLMTDFLMRAEQRGNPIVTGIGMLLHQARPAFEKWYSLLPDVTVELQKKVLV